MLPQIQMQQKGAQYMVLFFLRMFMLYGYTYPFKII